MTGQNPTQNSFATTPSCLSFSLFTLKSVPSQTQQVEINLLYKATNNYLIMIPTKTT